jgi:hypothetical protein
MVWGPGGELWIELIGFRRDWDKDLYLLYSIQVFCFLLPLVGDRLFSALDTALMPSLVNRANRGTW